MIAVALLVVSLLGIVWLPEELRRRRALRFRRMLRGRRMLRDLINRARREADADERSAHGWRS